MEDILIPAHTHRFHALAINGRQSGTPMVLIHGLLCSVYFWMPKQLEFLYAYGPLYSIALPAHAPSRAPSNWKKADESVLLQSMEQQIDALVANQPVILIGHSTGGTVALLYALKHPQRVKGIVTLGAAHSGKEEGGVFGLVQWAVQHLGKLGTALLTTLLWVNGASRSVHRFFLKDVVADAGRLFRHPDLDDYIDDYFPYQLSLTSKAMMPFFRDLIHLDLADRLQSLHTPVLVLCGDRDPYVSRERTRFLTDCMPNAHMHLIRNCGHWPMFEQPEEYEEAIRRFLDGLG